VLGIQRNNLKSTLLSEPIELPGETEAIRSGAPYQRTDADGVQVLTIPIKLREQIVGVLNIRSGEDRSWSEDEMDIVSAIVERAALSIENARLIEESRLVAERERVIGEISNKLGASTEIEAILQTAVRELGSHIAGTQVTVEIGGGAQ
jgi:transcriptional regulator with GAF, ATPase, and Fis domain